MRDRRIAAVIAVLAVVFCLLAAGCGKRKEPEVGTRPGFDMTSPTDPSEVIDIPDASVSGTEPTGEDEKTGNDKPANPDSGKPGGQTTGKPSGSGASGSGSAESTVPKDPADAPESTKPSQGSDVTGDGGIPLPEIPG